MNVQQTMSDVKEVTNFLCFEHQLTNHEH